MIIVALLALCYPTSAKPEPPRYGDSSAHAVGRKQGPNAEAAEVNYLAGRWVLLESMEHLTLQQVEFQNSIPRLLYLSGKAGRRALLVLPQSMSASSDTCAYYWKWKTVLAGGEPEARLMLTYSNRDCTLVGGVPSTLMNRLKSELPLRGPFSKELFDIACRRD